MNRKDILMVLICFLILWCAITIPILLSPLGQYPVIDASWHNVWAEEIAEGKIFVYAPYFRAPLYPFVLGLVYSVTGGALLSGVLLSFFFGILSVHILQKTVFHRAGRVPSLVAAGLYMLYGVSTFYTSTLLIAPMYSFLLILSFFLLDREKPHRLGWLFLGLAAVTRPGAILLFPLALILYRKAWRSSWILLVPVILVWIVNCVHGDRATIISSQGGINFYIGSGPEADGYTAFAPSGSVAPSDSLPYLDNVWCSSYVPFDGEEVLPSEVSSWWVNRTLDYIAENPGDFLLLTAKKVIYLISPVAVPSNYDVYYFTEYSPILKILAGSPKFPVSGLLLWLILPGALVAGKLSWGERNTLLWVACLAAGIIPFFVTARFRLPMLPLVVILLVPRVLRNIKKSALLAPFGLAAGIGLAMATEGTVETGGVNMAFYDGIAHFQQGDEHGAEVLLLKATEVAFERIDGIDLNGVDALYNLGIISIRRRDTESARMYWEMALERNPGFAPAREGLTGLTR